MKEDKIIHVDFVQRPSFDAAAAHSATRTVRRARNLARLEYTAAGIESLMSVAIGLCTIASFLIFLTII